MPLSLLLSPGRWCCVVLCCDMHAAPALKCVAALPATSFCIRFSSRSVPCLSCNMHGVWLQCKHRSQNLAPDGAPVPPPIVVAVANGAHSHAYRSIIVYTRNFAPCEARFQLADHFSVVGFTMPAFYNRKAIIPQKPPTTTCKPAAAPTSCWICLLG